MSFILDALKKSEADRKRQDAPGIASIPESGRQRSGPHWMWLVAGLLAINLVVLLAIVFRPGTESAPQNATSPPVTRAQVDAPVAEPATTTTAHAPGPTATSEPVAVQSAPTEAEIAAGPPVTPEPQQQVTEGLRTFNELRVSGLLQLPDMHIDIHVYSGQPADRFVFVNMQKYRESAVLNEGPVVKEITADGVVLSYQGLDFLLPRE